MAVSPAMPGVGEIVKIDVEGSPTRRDRADGQPQRSPTPETLVADRPRLDRAVLAFVALGIVLRVGHYLSNYPLWGDEAFLALNFLRRGYLDLLAPLDYGQICPILFLWAELTAVKLFGFSEMSLRLCPLILGVASVFLFRHVAVRLLKGPAVLMAVAIFAVSIHPIRHSADVKPYASDLLMALTLLAFAIEWFVSPERTGWLWALAGFVPFALAASYPAVFVATGIALALAASVWRTKRRAPRLALATYVLVVATTCVAQYVLYVHRQRGASLPALQSYWADSFPPLDSAVRLASWLITTHAGSMFAYPAGGGLGASSGTLILVLIAAVVLWRQGRGTILALLVMPMGIALAAAALEALPIRWRAPDHAVYRPGSLPDGRPRRRRPSRIVPVLGAASRRNSSCGDDACRHGGCRLDTRFPTSLPVDLRSPGARVCSPILARAGERRRARVLAMGFRDYSAGWRGDPYGAILV